MSTDKSQPENHTVVQLEQPQTVEPSTKTKNTWQYEETVDEVILRLNTDVNCGLSSPEADVRLQKHGKNGLTEHEAPPWWADLFSHFTDLFSLLLQLAAILSFVAYLYDLADISHLYLGIFLYCVVIVTSCFSFAQQRRSDRILREFRNLLPITARVIRDGKQPAIIQADQLVFGDIVQISAGDCIPADIRVISCDDAFAVDNATLTGESTPIILNSRPSLHGRGPMDSGNMAFFGCFAIEGQCTGVVVATGDHTTFGKIAGLTEIVSHDDNLRTTLQRDVRHFVYNVSVFAAVVGVFFFLAGIYLRVRLAQNVVYTLGIIVSNIPEGMLATVSASLTASARRMARKNVLVKRLDAVETLGSTDVIVTDKTGTLTEARMSVAHLSFAGTVCNIGTDWKPPTQEEGSEVVRCFESLLHGSSVCSSAVFFNLDDDSDDDESIGSDESWSRKYQRSLVIDDKPIRGDASEAGILRFTQKLHDTIAHRDKLEIVTKIPFNSRDKLMVTVDNSLEDDHSDSPLARVVMKGAPESILQHCESRMCEEGVRGLTSDDRLFIERQVEYFAQRGERVLAYAEKLVPRSRVERPHNEDTDCAEGFLQRVGMLTFIGLISLTDPPREGAEEAVRKLRNAGIRILMVTGDHMKTALSIAESTGVVTNSVSQLSLEGPTSESGKALLIHGSSIPTMSDDAWGTVLSRNEVVFARATPEDKVTIVKRLRQAGHVVTATGDGCNDAPALRAANAGVAMGRTGSDVSRAAADVVLLNDNFCNLVDGVREGRLIFDNLRKSIAYTLASNIPQLVPFIAFVILRLPLPLTATLVLCIDLGTDVFPAIALAYEPVETNILVRAPRRINERLLDNRLVRFSSLHLGALQTMAGFLAYFIVFNDAGLRPWALPGLARNGYFGSFRPERQRWLVTEKRASGRKWAGYRGTWFSRKDDFFARYFSTEVDGFVRQGREDYSGVRYGSVQFSNMIKIIGAERRRPPCAAYTCGGEQRNNISCFDPTLNSGLVRLDVKKRNHAVVPGSNEWEGCFELWTPRRQRKGLRTAQSAFFTAVVVAQVFTVFACRTRVVSVMRRMFRNMAVWVAIAVEILVAALILYATPISTALRTFPLSWVYWLPALPFGMFIVIGDEIRKWLIRRHLTNSSGLVMPGDGFVDRFAKHVYNLTFW